MNENLEKYIKSLPLLGLLISILLIVLFFFILDVYEDLFVVFLYCLLPLIVNLSIYGFYVFVKRK
ncbi:TPA: hypothetical protein PZF89_002768 [Staphylococcus aureus]|nr:hypothetical protein [Staphylococcus aureus]HDM1723845.1 hypothetical protein [Staphylococcus aureus]HDM1726635.1 hypothetical protein [Staphylococcus aureus]HDM1732232.1 hypothetical protein [Staphylococcus aureus]HDM1735067.1 hypothetical protein [Staphylococcus aureus]